MPFWELIAQASNWMEQVALQYGYVGIFAIAFIGAVSIFIPIPYTVVIFALGSRFDPVLLALAAGFGASIGEFSSYMLGAYGHKLVGKDRLKKMEYMAKVFSSWGPIAIFLFALTPLPDDWLFIPLGMMRYSIPKAFLSALSGKILMNFIVAYGGRFTNETIRNLFGEGSDVLSTVLTAVIGVALMVIIVIIIFKLDWEKIYNKYVEKGERKKVENNR